MTDKTIYRVKIEGVLDLINDYKVSIFIIDKRNGFGENGILCYTIRIDDAGKKPKRSMGGDMTSTKREFRRMISLGQLPCIIRKRFFESSV